MEIIRYFTKQVVIRYLIAGGTSGVVDLVALYLFNNVLGIYYLFSVVLAFLVAFFVSFLSHKFWTFKNYRKETRKQIIMYLFSSVFGLFLNTILMYIFVDYFHLQVILSQIIVGLLVACVNFFTLRNIVFNYISGYN